MMFLFDIRSSLPKGLEDVSRYPYLLAELMADARWTDEDIKKVAGLNFLRVFGKVEKASILGSHASSFLGQTSKIAPDRTRLKIPYLFFSFR